MWLNDVAYLFPIRSQTSETDRHWIAQLIGYVRGRHREYRYVEVGSYIGGTLTPVLLDDSCVEVLSIDLRPKLQGDSRNADYDYSKITTATMLAELKTHGLDGAKLTTFDGCAHDYDFQGKKFQMAFIDAEHTDAAVFRDFLAVYDHLDENAICGFHDANLITPGLENILAFLAYQRRKFWFATFRKSVVSAIFLDLAEDQVPRDFLDHVWDWTDFKKQSGDQLLLSTIKNRLSLQFALKDRPIIPM